MTTLTPRPPSLRGKGEVESLASQPPSLREKGEIEGHRLGRAVGEWDEPRELRRNIVIGQRVEGAKVRRAKELRRELTAAEQRLWQALRTNRLHGAHFRRQQVIDGFIVDFYCHAAGLIVEVDGPVHDQQGEYDAERDRILSLRSLRTLRVSNEEVMHNLAGVLTRISAELHGRPRNEIRPQPSNDDRTPPSLAGKGGEGG